MTYLTILSLASFSGAVIMLYKRVEVVAPHVEIAGRYAHTNFILEFVRTFRSRARRMGSDFYAWLRPHAHDLAAAAVSKMYKVSSWFALEFLKFYNFIQGRRVLKNSGSTSIFIRDMTREKTEEGVTSVRKVYRSRKPQVSMEKVV